MTTDDDDSSSSQSSVADIGQAHEYFEELDEHTLDFRKRKAPTPVPTVSFIKRQLSTVVDPIKALNKQLNRQFRPDLVPATPPPPPPPITVFLPSVNRTPSPDPVIFDSHAKPVKPPAPKREPSVSIKQKLYNRLHQLTAPTPDSESFSIPQMPHQQTMAGEFRVPTGMMLVPAPQQSIPMMTVPSQQPQAYAMTSQYIPPTVVYNNSFKNNKVAPPPTQYAHNGQAVLPNNSFQSPSSMISTNPLIQSSYALQQVPQYVDQSKSNKKTKKKRTTHTTAYKNEPNRSFALYNQGNGRIEGVVKNRLNVVSDEAEGSKITDEDPEAKGKWALWLSQPLCLGLTRLSGGILFGSMALLGAASIAGLIASISLYTQDSVTDAQWKILGMVVCAIMLITIIVTLLIFVCCYKHGYMFNKDDDIDPNDPSATQDADGNDRQKAVLRKIYKFNRPNDTSSIPSDNLQDVSTPTPMYQPTYLVTDKQTNTEATIAPVRPRDLDRGVWPSINAYNGISYRPLIQPQTASRFIQVLPHEIDEAYQGPQIIYQIVAPAAAIPPQQLQPRIIQMPAQEASVVEVIETTRKQPRTTIIRQPQTQQIVVQPTTRYEYVEEPPQPQRTRRIEYVDAEEPPQQQRTRRIEYVEAEEPPQQQRTRRIEYVDAEEPPPQQRTRRIEYIDADDQQRPRRVIQQQQQPQYEIVEEIGDRSSSASSSEDYVQAVNPPKHARQHGKKKEKKPKFGKISVKHVKSVNE